MKYIEVYFKIKALDSAEINAEMVREILVAELGALNFESFLNNSNGLQAYVQEEDFDEESVRDLYILHNSDFAIDVQINTIEQQNWNAEWEKNFEPIEVDDKCVVRAPFHEKKDVEFDIVITPKMSFGTGHHETTRLIAKAIFEYSLLGKKVLDSNADIGFAYDGDGDPALQRWMWRRREHSKTRLTIRLSPNGSFSISRAFWILDVASSISAVSDDAGLFFGDFIGILTKLHTHCRCLSTGFFAKIENVFSVRKNKL